jgi:hypothetical protein
MMKDFETLLKTIEKFQGVSVVDSAITPDTLVIFKCTESTVAAAITSFVNEIQESHTCKLMVFSDQDDKKDATYQITFEGDEDTRTRAVILMNKMFKAVQETGNLTKARQKELGLPDMSLTTIRQMATELKKRENLCFAIVWIEDNDRDNIAIEGSGNPTQLVGLLARGLHMAIEWADKNIKFHNPNNEA